MPDPYREALLRAGARMWRLGGFQRTPRGDFYIKREDVDSILNEELVRAEDEAASSRERAS